MLPLFFFAGIFIMENSCWNDGGRVRRAIFFKFGLSFDLIYIFGDKILIKNKVKLLKNKEDNNPKIEPEVIIYIYVYKSCSPCDEEFGCNDDDGHDLDMDAEWRGSKGLPASSRVSSVIYRSSEPK